MSQRFGFFLFRRPPGNRKGFTLTEIVVSAILLSIISTGLFSVLASSRYLVARSKMRLNALELLRSAIERQRQYLNAEVWNLPYPDNPITPAPDVPATPGGWVEVPGGGWFQVEYKVEYANPANYRKITARAKWW